MKLISLVALRFTNKWCICWIYLYIYINYNMLNNLQVLDNKLCYDYFMAEVFSKGF